MWNYFSKNSRRKSRELLENRNEIVIETQNRNKKFDSRKINNCHFSLNIAEKIIPEHVAVVNLMLTDPWNGDNVTV